MFLKGLKVSSACELVAGSAPVTLLIPACNAVTELCARMGEGRSVLAVAWVCVFPGNVSVVFPRLPKGKGR